MVYYMITVSTYKKFKQLLHWNGYYKMILNFLVCLLGNFGLAALDTVNLNTLHLRLELPYLDYEPHDQSMSFHCFHQY